MLVTDQNQTKFDTYVQNYCDNYAEQLAERYMFVEQLIPEVTNQTNFTITCENLVIDNPNLNAWFDPIALSEKTTTEEVCSAQYEAFYNVSQSYDLPADDIWVNDYLEASYMSSLTLYIQQ